MGFVFLLCPVLLLVLLSIPCGASPLPPPPPPLTPLSPSSSGCSPTDVDEPEVIDLRPNVSDEFSWLEDDKPARSATTSGADLLAAGSFGPRGDTNVHLIGASLVCDCAALIRVCFVNGSAHSWSTRCCGCRLCSRVGPRPPPSTWTHRELSGQPCPPHRLRRRKPVRVGPLR